MLSISLISACSSPDEPDPGNNDPKIDETLTKKITATEADAIKTVYETYYKPANAVTGDPMPYYNELIRHSTSIFFWDDFRDIPVVEFMLPKQKILQSLCLSILQRLKYLPGRLANGI